MAGAATACLLAAILAGCASSQAVKERHEAAVYNTELGIAYMRRGELAVAQRKLDRAERENPDDPDVHSARALLYARLREPRKADREFREALRLAPQNPDFQNNYAVYLCSAGRTDEGVKRFIEAARNPLYLTPALAYTNAGVCLRSAHRYPQAARMFRAALAVAPDYAQAAWQLADLDFSRGKLAEARTEIHDFLASYSETPDLLLLAVKVTRAQGDELDAALYAHRLQLDYPGSPQARALATIGRNPG
jgi:type IV pilus assembly protein PilF